MLIALNRATIFTPAEVIEHGSIVVSDDGRVAYLGTVEGAPRAAGPRYDMHGRIVAPGFIDIHVHGGHGITFGNLGRLTDELRIYSRWIASHGVTGFLCTLTSPDQESLLWMVAEDAKLLTAAWDEQDVPSVGQGLLTAAWDEQDAPSVGQGLPTAAWDVGCTFCWGRSPDRRLGWAGCTCLPYGFSGIIEQGSECSVQ